MKRFLVYLAVPIVYLLHQDVWWWDDHTHRVLGMPIGLTYQVAYCGLAALLMWCLVRLAWPAHLEVEVKDMQPAKGGPWH